MKQANDDKTLELPITEKRTRGRPPKPDAMTGAERAKRFRDAHRGEATAVTVIVTEKAFRELQSAEQSRAMALASAHAEIRLLTIRLSEMQTEIDKLKKRK